METVQISAKERLVEEANKGLVALLDLSLIELDEAIINSKGDSSKISRFVDMYWTAERTAEMMGIDTQEYRERYRGLIGNHNKLKYGIKR